MRLCLPNYAFLNKDQIVTDYGSNSRDRYREVDSKFSEGIKNKLVASPLPSKMRVCYDPNLHFLNGNQTVTDKLIDTIDGYWEVGSGFSND
jgi:hypothetical protein